MSTNCYFNGFVKHFSTSIFSGEFETGLSWTSVYNFCCGNGKIKFLYNSFTFTTTCSVQQKFIMPQLLLVIKALDVIVASRSLFFYLGTIIKLLFGAKPLLQSSFKEFLLIFNKNITRWF